MIHGPLKVNCVLKYVHTSHRTVKTGQMVSISDKNRWGALSGPGNMVIMTSVVLMVSRAVPPAPVLWSGAGAPDTGCRVQCRCVPLPQPREAPQPSGSARTRPGRGKSRSPRPPCRGWWALGKWFWTLSQCWNGKRGKQELETENLLKKCGPFWPEIRLSSLTPWPSAGKGWSAHSRSRLSSPEVFCGFPTTSVHRPLYHRRLAPALKLAWAATDSESLLCGQETRSGAED